MAKYKVLNKDVKRNIYEFLVDKTSDLNSLPKAAGSTALVADSNEKYICNNAKEWKALSNTGTNSGSDNNSNNSAGGSMMYITMTYDNIHDKLKIDKTFAEIEQAILAGTIVILRQKNIGDGELISVRDYQFIAIEPEAYVEFGVTTIAIIGNDDHMVFYDVIKINSNNEISNESLSYGEPSPEIG